MSDERLGGADLWPIGFNTLVAVCIATSLSHREKQSVLTHLEIRRRISLKITSCCWLDCTCCGFLADASGILAIVPVPGHGRSVRCRHGRRRPRRRWPGRAGSIMSPTSWKILRSKILKVMAGIRSLSPA